MPKAWTPDEVEFARSNWKLLPRPEIARQLGRSLHAVTHYAYRCGWSKHEAASTYSHLAPEERAYIAGMIDGEGHISIRLGLVQKSGRRPGRLNYDVSVVISNTHLGSLEWMQRRLPGSRITAQNPKNPKPQWHPRWVLSVRRRGSVRSLLTEVLPYLIIKRDRALEALAAIDGIHNRQWR